MSNDRNQKQLNLTNKIDVAINYILIRWFLLWKEYFYKGVFYFGERLILILCVVAVHMNNENRS